MMSGCILEYIGQVAYMAGVHAERQRARDSRPWIRDPFMAGQWDSWILMILMVYGLLENSTFLGYNTYII